MIIFVNNLLGFTQSAEVQNKFLKLDLTEYVTFLISEDNSMDCTE